MSPTYQQNKIHIYNYRAKNPESASYENNKESITKWQTNNKEKYREQNSKIKKRAYAWKVISITFRNILLI